MEFHELFNLISVFLVLEKIIFEQEKDFYIYFDLLLIVNDLENKI